MKHFLLLTLIALGCTAYAQNKTYQLSFNPANGDKYDMLMNMVTMVAQNIDGQNMNVNITFDIVANSSITDAGANKDLKVTYDKLRMVVDVMDQKIKFDTEDDTTSDDDKSRKRQEMMKAMKGAAVTITLQPDGKVLGVKREGDIWKKIAGHTDGEEAIKKFEDAMKNMVEQSFGFYPGKPIKIGDSWNSTATFKTQNEISATGTYTLTKVEGNKGFLDFSGTMKSVEGPNLTGEMKGNFEVDMPSGMTLLGTLSQDLKGEIETGEQKMPITVHSIIKMTNTKK